MVLKLHLNHPVLLEWLEMREAKEYLDLGWMKSALGFFFGFLFYKICINL